MRVMMQMKSNDIKVLTSGHSLSQHNGFKLNVSGTPSLPSIQTVILQSLLCGFIDSPTFKYLMPSSVFTGQVRGSMK